MEMLILCAGAGKKTWEGAENDRQLKTAGKRQAQKIGAWLGRAGLSPDLVLTSLDIRSRVSAEKALKAAGWTARTIQFSQTLDTGHFPQVSNAGRVLMVVPCQTAKKLLQSLGLAIDLSSGFLLVLQDEKPLAALTQIVDPSTLPDRFPYPSPDGADLRDRPAYYYTQSAVIPFRRKGGQTQILIVGSSSGRHWVVPKGIVEPGLGPSQSAAVEAREEAGVTGRISNTPIGHYGYEKWGATCEVSVFSMEVTEVLPDDQWEEIGRARKWVSVEDAVQMLHQPAYASMIKSILR